MTYLQNEIREILTDIFRELYLQPAEAIDETERLFHDRRLYGDDAIELLTVIGDRFAIDMQDFDFNQYFPSEGMTESFLICMPLPKSFTEKFYRRYKPLSFNDLVNLIADKKPIKPSQV